MIRVLTVVVLILLSIVILSVLPSNKELGISGRVIKVHDGDTVTFLSSAGQEIKVRLAGIDAPELDQAFGVDSRKLLSDLIYQEEVILHTIDQDKYGRHVAWIFIEEEPINETMIARGGAWVFRKYTTDRNLIELEKKAQRVGQGLWSLPEEQQIPPWIWREGRRM